MDGPSPYWRQCPHRQNRGPMRFDGLPENALLLVDSAPIIYVLEDHSDFACAFRPVFEARDAGLLRFAVTTVTVAEVLTGPLGAGADALVTHDRDFSAVRDLRVFGVET